MTSTTLYAIPLALVFMLAGFGTASGQSPPAAPSGGVEVHGHWVLEVRDGDRIVARREFENALTSRGGPTLAEVFAGTWAPGGWRVDLMLDLCSTWSLRYNNGSCETGQQAAMTASVPTEGANAGKLVLRGTASDWVVNTTETANVEGVRTWLTRCEPSAAPASCDPTAPAHDGSTDITQRTDITPLPLEAGQDVLVTVILTFN